jgi:lambda repressor-like predicted transcriptional regulator
MMTEDPFTRIRELSSERSRADWAWRDEVMNLKAAGFSLRTIADVAGVSHDTIWRIR